VCADVTIAIQTLKRIHIDPNKSGVVGRVFLVDVGIPVSKDFVKVKVSSRNFMSALCHKVFSEVETIHKGNRPRVLVIGGSEGKGGAAILSALGALRTGASLVTIASFSGNISQSLLPEMMLLDLTTDLEFSKLKALIQQSSAVVIGPGLGVGEDSLNVLRKTLETCKQASIPLLIDADGVVLLGEHFGELKSLVPLRLVLTPHPKEFAHLTAGLSVKEVLQARFEISQTVSRKFSATIVLKGPRTIISNDDEQFVNPHIVSSLAVGGSGDVLSGIIGAILGRLENSLEAAALGVYLHGDAGCILQQRFEIGIGVLASEIADKIPEVISALDKNRYTKSFATEPLSIKKSAIKKSVSSQ